MEALTALTLALMMRSTGMHRQADYPAGELIHDHERPVALELNGIHSETNRLLADFSVATSGARLLEEITASSTGHTVDAWCRQPLSTPVAGELVVKRPLAA